MYTKNRRKLTRSILTVAAFLLIMLMIGTPKRTEAASSISIEEINYLKSTITLKVNDGDTEVYFSDSKKTNWQAIPEEIRSDNTISFDISWVDVSKSYVLTFKANKSTDVISVTLPKQVINFKATYNKVKGAVSFSNVGTRTIEWRKKGSTIWNTVNISTLPKELSYLTANGATVYFRLEPVNGTGASKLGFRASKEVTVTIPKKTNAPQITINGSAFSIAVKKGMAYRTVNSDGTTTDWINIGSSADLLLKNENVAAKALYTTASSTRSDVILQFRTNATNSAQVSKITTVTVPVQEGPPDVDTYGIELNSTSSTTVALKVKAANSTMPFEYTVIKKDEEINYQTAKWTAITSSTEVSLNKKTAPEGSHIYVRKKSVNNTNDDNYALASFETDVLGAITYPGAPTASTLKTLISTAGVCQPANSSGYLTFNLYNSTSTTVSEIHFLDAYGIDRGTATCKSTVVKNNNSTDPDGKDKYIITTKITSTSNLDTNTKEILYAKIILANTDVITSTDKAGVLLYLYPASTVNNPTSEEDGYKDYTNSFNRIYMSNDSTDKRSFKFRLDLGTAQIPSDSAIDNYSVQAVEISSIKYDGYTLIKKDSDDTDYSVNYDTHVNDDGKTIRRATVTVNVANFEKSISITDVAEALRITLNNGEVLDDDVKITLINTATLDNIPISWTISEGKLPPTKTTTTTGPDGKTITTTEDLVSYTLTLTLFDKNYSVGVSNVTWGGISVLGSTTIINGTATINLSNAKLNTLTTTSTDTKNIIITFSNGFTISTGCKLTVLDAAQ